MTTFLSTVSCHQSKPDQNQWLGTFAVEQQCDGATTPSYRMKVRQATGDTTKLILDNLGGYKRKVNAVLEDDRLIIIPTDVSVGLMGEVRLSGSGAFQDETLVIDLTVDVPGPRGTTTQSQCRLMAHRVVE